MTNPQTATRLCPICNNTDVEVLLDLKMAIQKNLGLPDKYFVVACEKCGFVYQDSEATLEDYENYYKSFNKYGSSPTILEETKELFSHYMPVFMQFVPKESLILDMGCAGGIFLNFLKENGYRNLTGVDPSYECVDSIKKKEIEAHVGSVYSKDLNLLENKFDLVIFSGVMEHLYDLKSAVCNIGKYLKDGGMVFIGVPDAERYYSYNNAMSYYFNFEHINHFSSISLDNLMAEFNYKNIVTNHHGVRFGDSIVPVFSSIYGKDIKSSSHFRRDTISSFSIKRYLDISESERNGSLKTIDKLLKSNEEIIVWGAGSVASALLSGTGLKYCNIKAFVDKDPMKQGNTLFDKSICPPDRLYGFNETIVVCAALYAGDIVREIREMGLNNKVVVLR